MPTWPAVMGVNNSFDGYMSYKFLSAICFLFNAGPPSFNEDHFVVAQKKCNLKIEYIYLKVTDPQWVQRYYYKLCHHTKATAGRKIICSCKNFHQQQDTIFLNTYLQLLENDRLIFLYPDILCDAEAGIGKDIVYSKGR